MNDSQDAAAMSPGMSSVATSTTSGDVEVSQRNLRSLFYYHLSPKVMLGGMIKVTYLFVCFCC